MRSQQRISPDCLATIFTGARTHYSWLSKPIAKELCCELYDIAKLGPTSANC